MMKINSSDNEILLLSNIGLEVEFYSDHSIEKTRRDLARILQKKILYFEKAHSDFKPTYDTFKIEPDYSGGSKTIELVTAPLTYPEFRIVLVKVFNYIKDNGSTNDRCSIHYNVSFDEKKVGNSFMTHMNVLKFILDFNEDYIYNLFPKRKNVVYAKSIKYIMPKNKFYLDVKEITNLAPTNFILPSTKYYGINFTKLIKGYLEFRYVGGKDYETRFNDIMDVINYSVITLYNSIQEKAYTDDNRKELEKIFLKYEKIMKSYASYDAFVKNFPGIDFTVDLGVNPKKKSMYYDMIKEKIFQLLSETSIKKCNLNYDSDFGKIQIKDAKLTTCYFIEGIELVDCEIVGNIKDCSLHDCTIVSSDLVDSRVYGKSFVLQSKLKNCYVADNSRLKYSYVFGKNTVFRGNMEFGIFREGNLTPSANISPETEVIDYKKIK